MNSQGNKQEGEREVFSDGSAVVTYPGGSILIIESNLSKESVLREVRPANYNDPPPPPSRRERVKAHR